MTEIGLLKEAGAVAITEGTRALVNANVFRRALMYAKDFDMLVVQHVEEPTLSSGVMNAGEAASRLGLSGNPAMSSNTMSAQACRTEFGTCCGSHPGTSIRPRGDTIVASACERIKPGSARTPPQCPE